MRNLIFLPAIFIIGAITSYEDLRYSKIRNLWVCAGLIYALGVYVAFWCISHVWGAGVSVPAESLKCLVNFFVSILVGYTFWQMRIWSPGDAKLFMVYSVLIPYAMFPLHFWKGYFYSFYHLLIVFVLAAVVLFFKAMAYSLKLTYISLKSGTFKSRQGTQLCFLFLKKTWPLCVNFILVFLFINMFRLIAGPFFHNRGVNYLILFAFMFVVSGSLRKLIKSPGFRTISIIFLAGGILCYVVLLKEAHGKYFFEMLRLNLFFSAAAIFVFKTIDFYLDGVEKKSSPFAHWMFLGALIVWYVRL